MFVPKKSHTVECQLFAITRDYSPSHHQMIKRTDFQNDMNLSIISMLVKFVHASFIQTIWTIQIDPIK